MIECSTLNYGIETVATLLNAGLVLGLIAIAGAIAYFARAEYRKTMPKREHVRIQSVRLLKRVLAILGKGVREEFDVIKDQCVKTATLCSEMQSDITKIKAEIESLHKSQCNMSGMDSSQVQEILRALDENRSEIKLQVHSEVLKIHEVLSMITTSTSTTPVNNADAGNERNAIPSDTDAQHVGRSPDTYAEEPPRAMPEQPSSRHDSYCTCCGAELRQGARYCGKCGAPLDGEVSPRNHGEQPGSNASTLQYVRIQFVNNLVAMMPPRCTVSMPNVGEYSCRLGEMLKFQIGEPQKATISIGLGTSLIGGGGTIETTLEPGCKYSVERGGGFMGSKWLIKEVDTIVSTTHPEFL